MDEMSPDQNDRNKASDLIADEYWHKQKILTPCLNSELEFIQSDIVPFPPNSKSSENGGQWMNFDSLE